MGRKSGVRGVWVGCEWGVWGGASAGLDGGVKGHDYSYDHLPLQPPTCLPYGHYYGHYYGHGHYCTHQLHAVGRPRPRQAEGAAADQQHPQQHGSTCVGGGSGYQTTSSVEGGGRDHTCVVRSAAA